MTNGNLVQRTGEGFVPFIELCATDLRSSQLLAVREEDLWLRRSQTAAEVLHKEVYKTITVDNIYARLTAGKDPDDRRGVAFNLTASERPAVKVYFEPLKWVAGKLMGDLYSVAPVSAALEAVLTQYESDGIVDETTRTYLGLHIEHELLRSLAILESEDGVAVDAAVATVPAGTYDKIKLLASDTLYKGIGFSLIRALQGYEDE